MMPGRRRPGDCEDCRHMLGPDNQGDERLCNRCHEDAARERDKKRLPELSDWRRGPEVQGGLPGLGKRR